MWFFYKKNIKYRKNLKKNAKMINEENFKKLSKKNKIKKIVFQIDNILLKIKLNSFEGLETEYYKLMEYFKLTEKLEEYYQLIYGNLYPFDFNNINKIEKILIEIKSKLIIQHNFSNNESDYVNYIQYGESDKILREFIVILDNLRSPFNVGSIIRSAEAFGFCTVILYGIAASIPREKIYKTSRSAEKLIEIVSINNFEQLYDYLKDKGYKIVVLEKSSNSRKIWDYEIDEKIAMVLGNEEFGVSEEFLEKADIYLQIPQFGIKNSINVASAFSIAASWLSYNYYINK